jgi:hypothetical protein
MCRDGAHYLCRDHDCDCEKCPRIAAYRVSKHGKRYPLVELPLEFEAV